jgi:hypothetical protein
MNKKQLICLWCGILAIVVGGFVTIANVQHRKYSYFERPELPERPTRPERPRRPERPKRPERPAIVGNVHCEYGYFALWVFITALVTAGLIYTFKNKTSPESEPR